MATTASSPLSINSTSNPSNKPQKKLFQSLSKFLSGKSRSKITSTSTSTSNRTSRVLAGTKTKTNNNINNTSGNGEGVPLRVVTRSRRTVSSSSIGLGDEDSSGLRGDGVSEISRLSSIGTGGAGADTDASIRPISPESLAPSSILSRETSTSNLSYAPTHKTFQSTSTKPTTLFSVESGQGGGGANRIAVVSGTGGGGMASPTSLSPSINPGITFSTLPTSSTPPPLSLSNINNSPYNNRLSPSTSTDQAPRFTTAHPRNNPHPASPPPDNASMLTLASSTFAPSFAPSRYTSGGGGGGAASLSGLGARGMRLEADEDASVRALAPSRRASDESLGSRSTWSAAVGTNLGGGKGRTASLRTVGTVGTSGTGGELLGTGGYGGGEGEMEEEEVGGNRTDEEGGREETEAQKVVRKEGGKSDALSGSHSASGKIEGEEHETTPTKELDSILTTTTSEDPSEVSTPSEHTPPASTLQLPISHLVVEGLGETTS